ncbi:lectin-like domain-containing protein [Convivina intestini]|uniref:Putative secreted protein n=1 Tax=Convivina intestini TaxID=1505726 RepID=A0A2U1D3V6_9LACO|nr:KxYKxGKxW signal peptide domain-containing protein [Convivina intestini]PVY82351.1 putative secreted protein [Convivina intestini]CAH1857394.1 hypothetical protein R077811_01492 [Convivina intestini]SDC14420.1 KxYKxGKxW signal peptide containing protein [Leuconostocaceae bacterium R-53105]
MKSDNIFNRNTVKTRFKMYKSGKLWLVSGISLFTLGLGGSANASADTSTKIDSNDDPSVNSVQNQPTLAQQSQVLLSSGKVADSQHDSALTVAQSSAKDSSFSLNHNSSQIDSTIGQELVSNEASLSNGSSQTSTITQGLIGVTQGTTVDNQVANQRSSIVEKMNPQVASVSQTAMIQDSQEASQADSTSVSHASSLVNSQSNNTQNLQQTFYQANTIAKVDSTSNLVSQSDSTLLAKDVSTASSLAIRTAASQSTSQEQALALAQAHSQSNAQAYAAPYSATASNDENTGHVIVTSGAGINDVFSKPALDPTGQKINNAAKISDDGTVVLTEAQKNQVGSIATKDKIDLRHDFHLTGMIDIGDRKIPDGGDGIGIAFSKENTGSVGYAGGFNGIGGLRNVIGFKLDTFPNEAQAPNPNGTTPEEKLGFPSDWKGNDRNGTFRRPYGAFVSTDDHGYITIDDGSKQVEGEDRTPKRISPAFQNSRATTLSVDFNASTRLMTITYQSPYTKNSLIWSRYLSDADVSQPVGLAIAASTGASTNRQIFKLTSIDYHRAATVNVKYMDEAGKEIAKGDVNYPDGWQKGKTYETKALDLGAHYKYLGLSQDSLPASGDLKDWGDNGTVIHLYHYVSAAESTSTSRASESASQSKLASESTSTSASTSNSVLESIAGSRSASDSTLASTSQSASESNSTQLASTSMSISESNSNQSAASQPRFLNRMLSNLPVCRLRSLSQIQRLRVNLLRQVR